MIISRAPLRISFVGGGSDIPSFYRKHGGAVLSTAIEKYVFVTLNKKFDNGIRIAYSRTEEVARVNDIEHSLVRAAMNMVHPDGGVEITTIADIPSRGTGLGSSSTFTVALLHALHAYNGRYVSQHRLAEESCRVEIDICGEPIGKQDQYAAAYGGLNFVEFHQDDTVDVTPVICKQSTIAELQKHMLLLYTGITRSASQLLKRQGEEVDSDRKKAAMLNRMVELTKVMRDELQSDSLVSFGETLHENWELKKGLTAGISTSGIDDSYEVARKHGAIGGKILGAGAGGFLLLFAPPERHAAICHALHGLRPIDFEFARHGSQIIFSNLD